MAEYIPRREAIAELRHRCYPCGECKTALEDMVGGCWDDSDDKPKLNYCPNCGAKMDGGDSDEVD